ncbi:MAG: glycosyltransferase family 39 protein [Acidobacteriota bacterium]
MSDQILRTTTAGTDPALFSDNLFFASNRNVALVILTLFLALGFVLRTHDLGVESLGEDELNKLQTVEEYRRDGLSGKNGEHPFLMKGLQTVSVVSSEKINEFIELPQFTISEEAALRFPIALFGTFTALLIFLLVSELFGMSIGLVSAIFWAIEPTAIAFDRIAKEDSLVLFFFILTSLFWVKAQTAAENGISAWPQYMWAAAVSFGALMASKYYPHLLAITQSYYASFQGIPATKWRLGKWRFLLFFVIMGVAFLLLNPTILLPDTWSAMLKFSTENRIAHDSYEFMGTLYQNKMSAWLAGVPWTFYYVFIAVKTSVPILVLFFIGLPMMFKRRMGDGRFFIFFWAFLWFMPFTFLGGKFTRYFAMAEPLILIVAAVGFCFLAKWISEKLFARSLAASLVQVISLAAVIGFPLSNSFSVGPHFRLFTNNIGGGVAAAGSYFPHDEFYDTSTGEIVANIASRAKPGAVVASETPELFDHYADKIGREDLIFFSLSDKAKVATLTVGDYVVLVKGRRYFSNSAYFDYLRDYASPTKTVNILGVTSASIYQLDGNTLAGVQALAK